MDHKAEDLVVINEYQGCGHLILVTGPHYDGNIFEGAPQAIRMRIGGRYCNIPTAKPKGQGCLQAFTIIGEIDSELHNHAPQKVYAQQLEEGRYRPYMTREDYVDLKRRRESRSRSFEGNTKDILPVSWKEAELAAFRFWVPAPTGFQLVSIHHKFSSTYKMLDAMIDKDGDEEEASQEGESREGGQEEGGGGGAEEEELVAIGGKVDDGEGMDLC